MCTHTLSCHVKLQAVKSPLKEAGGVPTNPEQEEGDAIPRAGSWGRDLGIAEDTKHQVMLCGRELNLLAPNH